MDRFTRLAGASHPPDITSDTVARTLFSGWITSFWCPQIIATHQERQSGSQLFYSLIELCSIHNCKKTPRYSAANSHVERRHRTLKTASVFHANQQWTDALTLVLLDIRTAYKEDIQSSAAELVCGEPLLLPGKLLAPPNAGV